MDILEATEFLTRYVIEIPTYYQFQHIINAYNSFWKRLYGATYDYGITTRSIEEQEDISVAIFKAFDMFITDLNAITYDADDIENELNARLKIYMLNDTLLPELGSWCKKLVELKEKLWNSGLMAIHDTNQSDEIRILIPALAIKTGGKSSIVIQGPAFTDYKIDPAIGPITPIRRIWNRVWRLVSEIAKYITKYTNEYDNAFKKLCVEFTFFFTDYDKTNSNGIEFTHEIAHEASKSLIRVGIKKICDEFNVNSRDIEEQLDYIINTLSHNMLPIRGYYKSKYDTPFNGNEQYYYSGDINNTNGEITPLIPGLKDENGNVILPEAVLPLR
jgi:hypothetical protein